MMNTKFRRDGDPQSKNLALVKCPEGFRNHANSIGVRLPKMIRGDGVKALCGTYALPEVNHRAYAFTKFKDASEGYIFCPEIGKNFHWYESAVPNPLLNKKKYDRLLRFVDGFLTPWIKRNVSDELAREGLLSLTEAMKWQLIHGCKRYANVSLTSYGLTDVDPDWIPHISEAIR